MGVKTPPFCFNIRDKEIVTVEVNMLLSQRFKFIYLIRVWQKRVFRYMEWFFDSHKYSWQKLKKRLPYRIKKHQAVLIRKLGNSDIELQYNKVLNLKLAGSKINGICIKPGETFSFWKLVGMTTKEKGYKEGMCLYYGRVLPFGSGASVFYNYIDLRFINTTSRTFQILIYFDNKYIKGEIRADKPLPYSYHIIEKAHQFIKKEGEFYRENEIWRVVIDRTTGNKICEELMIKNFCEVKYKLNDEMKINN